MQGTLTGPTSKRLVHLWRFLVRSLVMTAVLCLDVVSASSQCPPEQYMDEHEPGRRALIVGNFDYTFQEDLPSAATDAEQMWDRLTNLRFKVGPTLVMKSKKEFFDSLSNFADTIEEGDLVVFYFSGHGFSYKADSFLAPTELPKSIGANELPDAAVALDSVRSRLEEKNPGMLIMIIDACRTIGDFVISPKNQSPSNAPEPAANGNGSTAEASATPVINLASPGLQEPRGGTAKHSLVAFAAQPGKVAIGTSAKGQMSTYTNWVVTYLPNEGKTVQWIFKEAATDVVKDTKEKQIPALISPWITDPFLRPTTVDRKEEKAAWEVALNKGIRDKIDRFVLNHSVTRHTAAARRWLKNPNCDAGGATAVSPIAVERAFRLGDSSIMAVRRLSARAYAFPRSMEAGWEKDLVTAGDRNVGIIPSATTEKQLATEKTGAQYLTNTWGIEPTTEQTRKLAFTLASMDLHENVVTTEGLVARAAPNDKAEVVGHIRPGTQLKIQGLVEGPQDTVWMQATIEGQLSPFLLKVDPLLAPQRSIVRLGKSVKELVIKPRPTGLPDLIDPKPLQDAVAELRVQGWTITWVSLSTGAVNDETEQAVRDARLAHAEFLLKQMGIPGISITAVTAVSDFKEDGVRIRFFGVGK